MLSKYVLTYRKTQYFATNNNSFLNNAHTNSL